MIRRTIATAALAAAVIAVPTAAFAEPGNDPKGPPHDRHSSPRFGGGSEKGNDPKGPWHDRHSSPRFGGYPGPGKDIDVPPRVTPGVPFQITISGPEAGSVVNLQVILVTGDGSTVVVDGIKVAGAQAYAPQVQDGLVTFDVTLNEAGTYKLAALDTDGATVQEAVITTADAATAGDTAATDPAASTALAGDMTSPAGTDPVILGAGGLLLAGTGAFFIARRRLSLNS
jgi:hypothetical protein